ncbi:hypothetical protein YC2023_109140 [Brassica napus]
MNIPTRNTRGLEKDNHIFKWVDEAFTDKIQQLDYQVRMLEEERFYIKLKGLRQLRRWRTMRTTRFTKALRIRPELKVHFSWMLDMIREGK